MEVYLIVFVLAGGFFWWLRRMGRRMQPPANADANGADDSTLADNLEFAADTASRLLRRKPRDSTHDGDAGGNESGGDGGG